jgi:hypothetical protein
VWLEYFQVLFLCLTTEVKLVTEIIDVKFSVEYHLDKYTPGSNVWVIFHAHGTHVNLLRQVIGSWVLVGSQQPVFGC